MFILDTSSYSSYDTNTIDDFDRYEMLQRIRYIDNLPCRGQRTRTMLGLEKNLKKI